MVNINILVFKFLVKKFNTEFVRFVVDETKERKLPTAYSDIISNWLDSYEGKD